MSLRKLLFLVVLLSATVACSSNEEAKLDIPPSDEPSTVRVDTPQQGKLHTIEKGESLYYIAQKYKLSINQLKALNPKLDSVELAVGLEIIVGE